MKSLTLLTILILMLGTGYIGFSILTFEPDTPQRYDLSIQTPESIDAIKGPSQEILSVQAEQKKADIISAMKKGISKYDESWIVAPTQAQTIKETLEGAIKLNKIPTYYPVSNFAGALQLNSLTYNVLQPVSGQMIEVSTSSETNDVSSITCETQKLGFLLGDTGDNNLSCDLPTNNRLRVHLTGPGNDTISVRGNALINAGTGNDTIKAGPEFTMVYVEPNFGQDTVNIDCNIGAIGSLNDPIEDLVPWKKGFIHYIVFDPRISRKDIKVSGNILSNTATGDKITLSKNCFNIVFTAVE